MTLFNPGGVFDAPRYRNVPIHEVEKLPLDDDGFSIPDNEPRPAAIRRPPPMVSMPKFFEGCETQNEAIAKMVDELAKPASIELDGWDAMYRRLADALILVLANQGGLTP